MRVARCLQVHEWRQRRSSGLSAWSGEDGTHVTAFAYPVTMKRHWRAIAHEWEEGEAQSEQDCYLKYKTLSIRAMSSGMGSLRNAEHPL